LWKYPGELNWYLNFSLSALKNIQKEPSRFCESQLGDGPQ